MDQCPRTCCHCKYKRIVLQRDGSSDFRILHFLKRIFSAIHKWRMLGKEGELGLSEIFCNPVVGAK